MEFLTKLFEFFYQLIPWPLLMSPDEGGIRIWNVPFLGSFVQRLTPGWYVNWPLFHDCRVIDIMTQPIPLPEQSLITKDNRNLTVAGAIRYRIDDPKKALLNVQDYDESVVVCGRKSIKAYIRKHTYEEAINDDGMEEEFLKELKKATRNWGLDIQEVYILEFSPAIVLRHLMNRE